MYSFIAGLGVVPFLAAILVVPDNDNVGQFVIPEPDGLADELRALPNRALTAEERQQLDRDGMVQIKGVIKDAALLRRLEALLWSSQQIRSSSIARPDLWNGVYRAFLREGPLGALAASALGSRSVRTANAQLWGYLGPNRNEVYKGKHVWTPMPYNPAHADDRFRRSNKEHEIITVWFAFTAAPQVMTFYLGSHTIPEEISDSCVRAKLKEGYNYLLNSDCVAERIQAAGFPAPLTVDAAAGDAFVFKGDLIHESVAQSNRRLATCIRAHAGDHPMDSEYLPIENINACEPKAPVVYPHAESTLDCQPLDAELATPCAKGKWLPSLLSSVLPFPASAFLMPCMDTGSL